MIDRRTRICRWASTLCWMLAPSAWAQAGPPMITNDPGTPGDGVWEINLAATGGKSRHEWRLDAPDIDINRGIGDRLQLSMHGAWAHAQQANGGWASGLADVEWALRWRFLDQEQAGIAMAVQPAWAQGWSAAAQRRGLASTHAEFVLPLQIARDFGHFSAGLEVARHFTAHEQDTWQAGTFIALACGHSMTCLAEINTAWPADDHPHSTFNTGLRRSLGAHTTGMLSLGSELSGRERQSIVFYVGVQVLR